MDEPRGIDMECAFLRERSRPAHSRMTCWMGVYDGLVRDDTDPLDKRAEPRTPKNEVLLSSMGFDSLEREASSMGKHLVVRRCLSHGRGMPSRSMGAHSWRNGDVTSHQHDRAPENDPRHCHFSTIPT